MLKRLTILILGIALFVMAGCASEDPSYKEVTVGNVTISYPLTWIAVTDDGDHGILGVETVDYLVLKPYENSSTTILFAESKENTLTLSEFKSLLVPYVFGAFVEETYIEEKPVLKMTNSTDYGKVLFVATEKNGFLSTLLIAGMSTSDYDESPDFLDDLFNSIVIS